MNIKITRKGNVKVDGVKYVFVQSPIGESCGRCAFARVDTACDGAPCVRGARAELGLPAHGGHFAKKESKQ
jgi:hypothetical protein